MNATMRQKTCLQPNSSLVALQTHSSQLSSSSRTEKNVLTPQIPEVYTVGRRRETESGLLI